MKQLRSLRDLWQLLSVVALPLLLLVAEAAEQAALPKMPPPAPRPPNVIFILADDLGYGDLGCYGQLKIKTPNLDRLAGEGMRFTSFYAGSTVCAPSRCSLMTGLHTGHARVRGNAKVPLLPEDVTVAEVLQKSGYRTGLIGKWGLGDAGTTGEPQRQGFEEFLGYLDQTHAHDYYTPWLWRYDFRTGFSGQVQFAENLHNSKGLYTHDLFTTAAANFLRVNKPQEANKNRPFFLYLAYTVPHANNEEGQRSGNGMEVPSDAPYSDQPWPQPEKNKAAMITRMDRDVGKLLTVLEALGQANNTLIFFTSDNGPHREGGVNPKFFDSSGPLRGIKRDLYEGGIRVPMIVRWPDQIRSGQVNTEPWAFWDILPTLAEAAGAKPPTEIDGISFLPALLGTKQTNTHDSFYWEFHEGGSKQALRKGTWKAIRKVPGQPLELYDLRADLGETNNVASANEKVVEEMTEYLKKARSESEAWPIKGPPQKEGEVPGITPSSSDAQPPVSGATPGFLSGRWPLLIALAVLLAVTFAALLLSREVQRARLIRESLPTAAPAQP
jgi:arylsulfatase A-like enzyme